jgi:septum formation protein
MKKLILASSSPRRKQLLEQIGLEFKIDASNIDEIVDPLLQPVEQVELFSKQKAEAIASKYTDALILAADSMVAINGEVLGKPKDKDDAKRMLKKLSGTQHSIVTGFTLIDTQTKQSITRSVETKVWFKKLSEEEIEAYITKAQPFDKAGSYGIQDLAAIFVEKIEGDYFGSVGLPLFALAEELKKFGVHVL